jgi:hypothetical protein
MDPLIPASLIPSLAILPLQQVEHNPGRDFTRVVNRRIMSAMHLYNPENIANVMSALARLKINPVSCQQRFEEIFCQTGTGK